MRSGRHPRGFTVVELLTVIGLITLILVLVLPSIQASRENARAIGCKNNLKQLGLAMHNYHDVFNTFPPGWVLKDDAAKTGPAHAWPTMILPYVDQAPLYNQINFHRPPSTEAVPALAKSFKTYRCPADKSPVTDEERGGFGTSNYAGNYGVDKFPGKEKAVRKGAGGLFHWNSRIGIRDITDGTSNTLLVGERGKVTGAGIWSAVRSNANADDVLASANDAFHINDTKTAYSGNHGGGAYFLFCDGSARFITEKIESSAKTNPPSGLFQQLAHRADNQVLTFDNDDVFVQPTGEKVDESAKAEQPPSDRPRTEAKPRSKKRAIKSAD